MSVCSAELNRAANKGLKPFVEKLRKAKKTIDARGAREGTELLHAALPSHIRFLTDGRK